MAFAPYLDAAADFCGHCYSADKLQRLSTTAPRELSTEDARLLLHETADHWSGTEGDRRYLPRILEALAPPESLEPLYAEHFPATLGALGFADWPEVERRAVLDFVDAITPLPDFSPEDLREWCAAWAALRPTGGP